MLSSQWTVAIAVGLIVMMWPILTKVQYETLPLIFTSRRIWIHIGISVVLNWIVGPLLMLGLAWATLPDLPEYRTGVIMVGIARCIAMVMIWIDIAKGDADYGAILVVINAVLQIVLFSPIAVLFINVFGGEHQTSISVSYGNVAISVLIVRTINSSSNAKGGLTTTFFFFFFSEISTLESRSWLASQHDILSGTSPARNSSTNASSPFSRPSPSWVCCILS